MTEQKRITRADGSYYYETFYGPLILTPCVDCGKEIGTRGRRTDDGEGLLANEGEPWPPPGWNARCTGCCRIHFGLDPPRPQ